MAKKYLNTIIDSSFSLIPVQDNDLTDPRYAPYEPKRSALIVNHEQTIGIIGEYKLSVINELKLPRFSAGFEIDTNSLKHLIGHESTYRPLSRFPSIAQDITLSVHDMPFEHIISGLNKALQDKVSANTDFETTTLDIYKPQDSDVLNYTFRIKFSNHERTLTDKEVTKLLDEVSADLAQKISAKRV